MVSLLSGVAEKTGGVDMRSSKSRGYRAQKICLFIVTLFVMNLNSAIRAGDKEEKKVACF